MYYTIESKNEYLQNEYLQYYILITIRMFTKMQPFQSKLLKSYQEMVMKIE